MAEKKVTMQEIRELAETGANRELTDDEIFAAVGGADITNDEPKFIVGDKVTDTWFGNRPGEVIDMEQRYVEGVNRVEWFYLVKWGIDANHPHESTRWEFEHMLVAIKA